MSNAFITGSRAYGKPKQNSDIDLVIRCGTTDEHTLKVLADKVEDESEYGGGCSLRFGKLNLIVCTNDERFAEWSLGTQILRRSGTKVTRDSAKKMFAAIRLLGGDKSSGD